MLSALKGVGVLASIITVYTFVWRSPLDTDEKLEQKIDAVVERVAGNHRINNITIEDIKDICQRIDDDGSPAMKGELLKRLLLAGANRSDYYALYRQVKFDHIDLAIDEDQNTDSRFQNFIRFTRKLRSNKSSFGGAFRSFDFSEAELPESSFSRCDLSHANFARADLRDCDFQNAVLINTNFSDADLRTSPSAFKSAILWCVNLNNAKIPSPDWLENVNGYHNRIAENDYLSNNYYVEPGPRKDSKGEYYLLRKKEVDLPFADIDFTNEANYETISLESDRTAFRVNYPRNVFPYHKNSDNGDGFEFVCEQEDIIFSVSSVSVDIQNMTREQLKNKGIITYDNGKDVLSGYLSEKRDVIFYSKIIKDSRNDLYFTELWLEYPTMYYHCFKNMTAEISRSFVVGPRQEDGYY